jgi:iron complex outermembrane receptor protein
MAGIANREPRRADIVEVLQLNQDEARSNREILPERLYNFEMGYRWNNGNTRFGVNFYYMHYYNQLVQTGRLNRSGSALLENVRDSYRMGVELEASVPIFRQLRFDGNATFSRNRIREYTAMYRNWDNWQEIEYVTEVIRNSNISFSPSVIGSGTLSYQPLPNLGFRLTGIYVGQQFMDNRSDSRASLDAYFVSNFSVSYRFQPQSWGVTELDLFVNNLFNSKHISNGWSAKSVNNAGEAVFVQGFFPQATRNFMMRMTVRF